VVGEARQLIGCLPSVTCRRTPDGSTDRSGHRELAGDRRFQEAEFHWPFFGNEFEEVTVASVPSTAIGGNRKLSFAKIMRTSKAAARVDE
jgi:hypothetical protein